MTENNQPKPDDAVLGGQSPVPPDALVLGGIEGLKRRLASTNGKQKIALLKEALKYGQKGLELLIHALEDKEWLVSSASYALLQENGEPELKQALDKDYLKLLKKKTILIVENDVINVRVYSKVFSKYSYLNVKHTEDVEEILRIAQAGEADLVLIQICVSLRDYEGKEVNGLDITKMLKSHPLTTNVPVILITANFSPGTSTLSVMEESGANFCIPKPITNAQIFVDQIRMFL